MKKFRYRLERVLQYRLIIKTEKLRDLTIRNLELQDAKKRLEQLENELLMDRFGQKEVMTIEEVTLAGDYTERLRNLVIKQHVVIEECEKNVQEALAAYIEAAKDAESLVKHKANKQQAYNEYIEKETQKFLDELTTQRIGRLRAKSLTDTETETLAQESESQSIKELI